MIIIEAALITTLLFTCIIASWFDLKKGIIPNRLILISLTLVIILDIFYYIIFAREFVAPFLINFAILSILSVLMYSFNLWAAGDSKLLFVILLAVPGRFLSTGNKMELAPAIFIIVFTFSLAYIYVVIESIVLTLKNRVKPNLQLGGKKFFIFLKHYYCCSVYLIIINYSLVLLFPSFSSENASLIMFFNLFLAILIYKYDFFFKKITVIVASIFAAILLIIYYTRYFEAEPNLKIYLYLAILLVVSSVAEKFNYQTIKTEEVKPGMILSWSTVIQLQPSRVQGLPLHTTEDMRSRITKEEADSIIRWKDSKFGQEEISIVRKVPFAIFMSLGSVVYLLFRTGVL